MKGIEKLSLLKKLSLSHNKLTEFEVNLGLGMLQELRLNDNKMVKCPKITNKALKVLDMGNNPFVSTDHTLLSLKNTAKECKKLENLNLKESMKIDNEKIQEIFPKLLIFNGTKVDWRDQFYDKIRKENELNGVKPKTKHV